MTRSKIAFIAATALTTLYAAGLYYEQNLAGPHCCGLTWPTPDPAHAERLMAKDDPKGVNPAVQRRTAVDVLAARPMESSAWLRLAYTDCLQHGQLTDEGRRALEISYLVLPYAGPQAAWRLAFVLENWSALSPQSRKDALAEMVTVKADEWSLRLATMKVLAKVRNPGGRMTIALMGLAWP